MPRLVCSVQTCQNIVQNLLLNEQSLAVSVKMVTLDKPGDIVLLSLCTSHGHTYIFDIKKTRNLMLEGQLWRILACADITKIMHDCRVVSAALKKQFHITLRGVFDTQAAFCVKMIHNGLPPRLIPLDHLYYKYGDPKLQYLEILQSSINGNGIYWAQRPMHKLMLLEAKGETSALFELGNSLHGELCPKGLEDHDELCYAYIHGHFKSKAGKQNRNTTDSTAPLMLLSNDQKGLLHGTQTCSC